MKVWEIKLKFYLTRDIKNENALENISKLIDKSLKRSDNFASFHKENKYKNYVFNSFFPVEQSKIYLAGQIYTVVIRTVDEDLVNYFEKLLVNEYTDSLKTLTLEKRIIPRKYISSIYNITPAIVKFEKGYWRTSETVESFEKRLRENLIKKYNQFCNTKIEEDFELFTFMKFHNHKPIASNYKNIRILGDKMTLNVAENSLAQDICYFALGAGILEMNSRGYGFVNYKWL